MDQPQITPGSNGYQAPVTPVDYGANPWALAPGQGASIYNQTQQGAQNIQNMGTQANQYATQSGGTPATPGLGISAGLSSYPSFPNAAGVGSQSAFGSGQQPSQPSSSLGSSPLTLAPDTTSRGFNPWSLMGEANARN